MRTLSILALLALTGACTNYATTATPAAKAAWGKSLPTNGGGIDPRDRFTGTIDDATRTFMVPTIKHISSKAWSPAAQSVPHGAVPVDCPEVDPAQARCGSGWTH